MSLVNAETGELLAAMAPDEARQVTERIRTAVAVAWELVSDAYQRRAWAALGYSSWDAYCSAEFGASRLRLPREERQEVVASLRESGLSIRAIAAATGMGKSQVADDLGGVRNRTPDPGPIDDDEWEPGGWLPQNQQPAPAPAPRPITGTDGKTYAPPSRPKLTAEEQREADVLEAHKRAARALEKLTDNWPYMQAWINQRDEIRPHLQDCTVEALDQIQETLR